MKLYLKCKDINVAELEYDLAQHKIELEKVIEPEYLPILVKYSPNKKKGFIEWLAYRSIPKTRRNLPKILKAANAQSIEDLALMSYGLSLSDSYWITPQEIHALWKDVNLYENYFTEVPQELLNAMKKEGKKTISFSFDSGSNGELNKYWKIKNNERFLYKESTQPYYQQAYNEVIADKLLTKMEIPHVHYEMEIKGDMPFSVCKTFTSPNIEYVPAWYILEAADNYTIENDYRYFFKCVDALNIPCSKSYIDTMLTFDYFINNDDRHYGNFGFLRNVETLEFIGTAPLFDHGNSLWYKGVTMDINRIHQPSKPFKEIFERQNKLITDSHLPVEKLSDDFLRDTVADVFKTNKRFDDNRISRIADALIMTRDQIISSQNRQAYFRKLNHIKSEPLK